MSPDFAFKSVDSADAMPVPLAQLSAGSLQHFLLGTRATELRADNASLPAYELAAGPSVG